MLQTTRAIFAAYLLLAPSAAFTADAPFTAEVIGVTDGDTITVLRDGIAAKIRLYGIDAPERRQPYYSAAKQSASQLVFGKTVRVEPHDRDRWRRIVAVVKLPDGRLLNHEIVRGGYVWHEHSCPYTHDEVWRSDECSLTGQDR